MFSTYKINFFALWQLTYMYILPPKPKPTSPGTLGDICARQLEVHITILLAILSGYKIYSRPNLGRPPKFWLGYNKFQLTEATLSGKQHYKSNFNRFMTAFGLQRQDSVVRTTRDPIINSFMMDFGLQGKSQWYIAMFYNRFQATRHTLVVLQYQFTTKFTLRVVGKALSQFILTVQQIQGK